MEHRFVWVRDLDIKKIGAEEFGELSNVVLEENGEDKMVRESIVFVLFSICFDGVVIAAQCTATF